VTNQEIAEYVQALDFGKIHKRVRQYYDRYGAITILDFHTCIFRTEFYICKYLVDEIFDILIDLGLLIPQYDDDIVLYKVADLH